MMSHWASLVTGQRLAFMRRLDPALIRRVEDELGEIEGRQTGNILGDLNVRGLYNLEEGFRDLIERYNDEVVEPHNRMATAIEEFDHEVDRVRDHPRFSEAYDELFDSRGGLSEWLRNNNYDGYGAAHMLKGWLY